VLHLGRTSGFAGRRPTQLGMFVVLAAGSSVVAIAAASSGRRIATVPERAITISATPSMRRIAAGAEAEYVIRVRRRGVAGRERSSRRFGVIRLGVARGLPPYARARSIPSRSRRQSWVVTVTTDARRTPVGSYRVWLRVKSRGVSRLISVSLIVAPRAPFTIGGQIDGLQLGVGTPLDLSLTNPNDKPLSVTSLTLTAQSVAAPNATASNGCTLADFSVQQFSAPYPLIVPALSTRKLFDLGIPITQWPQAKLVDTSRDQDGCKGASLALAYGGTATLG